MNYEGFFWALRLGPEIYNKALFDDIRRKISDRNKNSLRRDLNFIPCLPL